MLLACRRVGKKGSSRLSSGPETNGERAREEAQPSAEGTSPQAQRTPVQGLGPPVMGPGEAAWLAWYMCAVSLALAAVGLLLLALGAEHPGVPVFEEWAEDTVVAVGFLELRYSRTGTSEHHPSTHSGE